MVDDDDAIDEFKISLLRLLTVNQNQKPKTKQKIVHTLQLSQLKWIGCFFLNNQTKFKLKKTTGRYFI